MLPELYILHIDCPTTNVKKLQLGCFWHCIWHVNASYAIAENVIAFIKYEMVLL